MRREEQGGFVLPGRRESHLHKGGKGMLLPSLPVQFQGRVNEGFFLPEGIGRGAEEEKNVSLM
jgi:hypothetical protein